MLKRTIQQRNQQRTLKGVRDPLSDVLSTDPPSMQQASKNVYEHLYSSELVDASAIQSIVSKIKDEHRISPSDSETLIAPFNFDELKEGVKRSPRKSSPGMDSLPYEILRLVFHHRYLKLLAIKIFNDALSSSTFPVSW